MDIDDEKQKKLVAFTRQCIAGAFEASMDSSDIQDALEKHGLIVLVPYDPKVHGEQLGEDLEVEPGDTIYEVVDWLKKEKGNG